MRERVEAFDVCGGQADMTGRYRYHAQPGCLLGQLHAADNAHSPQVGVARHGMAACSAVVDLLLPELCRIGATCVRRGSSVESSRRIEFTFGQTEPGFVRAERNTGRTERKSGRVLPESGPRQFVRTHPHSSEGAVPMRQLVLWGSIVEYAESRRGQVEEHR